MNLKPKLPPSLLFFNLPWLMLVVVACVQVFLASNADLSPWKGGGFGMFAKDMDRQVRLYGLQPNEEGALVESEIRGRSSFVRRARNFPTEHNLRRLLENTKRSHNLSGRPVRSLRAEVWRVHYEPTTKRLTSARLKVLHDQTPDAQDLGRRK